MKENDAYTALVIVVKDYLSSDKYVTRKDVEFFSRTISPARVKQAKAQAMRELLGQENAVIQVIRD
jgi:hypothetical protein|tara:strand:+ start:481 stop:678 length:198 start_codon:yes stop_codon:yes gene_type:complete